MGETGARRSQGGRVKRLLQRAARMLDELAQLERESCQLGKRDWACEDCQAAQTCPTKKRHGELVATAKELREAA